MIVYNISEVLKISQVDNNISKNEPNTYPKLSLSVFDRSGYFTMIGKFQQNGEHFVRELKRQFTYAVNTSITHYLAALQVIIHDVQYDKNV